MITAPPQPETSYYLIKSTLAEDRVWESDISPQLSQLPDNVRSVWHYCFTEMFNNAIDHSDGTVIWVSLSQSKTATRIEIGDDGDGIFRHIQRALKLSHPRESILELSKGKLTTDPKNHSGEGIFFTSRMMNTFAILSRGLVFFHDENIPQDWLIEAKNTNGTSVIMQLANDTPRKTVDIFDEYCSTDGDYRFNKTVVPVRLVAEEGQVLVSRSQAKRLVSRIDKFENVVLDFQGVTQLGQGFADQVFRIFAEEHPQLTIEFINANNDVLRAIAHVRARSTQR